MQAEQNEDVRERLIEALVALVAEAHKEVPAPVYEEMRPLVQDGRPLTALEEVGGAATARLLALGARAEDLQALARFAYGRGVGDALAVIDGRSTSDAWALVEVDLDADEAVRELGDLAPEVRAYIEDLGTAP